MENLQNLQNESMLLSEQLTTLTALGDAYFPTCKVLESQLAGLEQKIKQESDRIFTRGIEEELKSVRSHEDLIAYIGEKIVAGHTAVIKCAFIGDRNNTFTINFSDGVCTLDRLTRSSRSSSSSNSLRGRRKIGYRLEKAGALVLEHNAEEGFTWKKLYSYLNIDTKDIARFVRSQYPDEKQSTNDNVLDILINTKMKNYLTKKGYELTIYGEDGTEQKVNY